MTGVTGVTGAPAPRRTQVVVVGGGQAGLSASWFLCRDGVDHVVLEAVTAGHEWASTRWDSFTLVTPNWQCRLPGYAYDGPDPDGFMTRDEVVAWLAGYPRTFGPPLRERTRVTRLSQDGAGGFLVAAEGPDGPELWQAEHVVLATGGYHRPVVPSWAPSLDPGLPDGLVQLHSAQYRRPDALPPGAVLVVGTGQSGAQIAEDLHLAGRSVHLAVGSAPRVARRHRGRDVMTWLAQMGVYERPVGTTPGGVPAREKTNHYVTGRGGGRDVDLRAFARDGMVLHGRVTGGAGRTVQVTPTVGAALDAADAVYASINRDVDAWIEAQGIDAPSAAPYEPVWRPAAEHTELDLHEAGVTSVVWAVGYRADWSWVDVGVFTGGGRPSHTRGVTGVPGLYLLGLPWLHTWGSGRFLGVAVDAEHVTACITGTDRRPVPGGRTATAGR
ncbi:MSMEG_0569 family flavin-dependent oxidoreductase [Jannaschia sp. R86511]|uniref:MSMEG_0569 family flavin-dependent oxidoreductase n=1 Tax=Jannaschia sp. R86511 TaxID=3093853 RepID=UPI0036D40B95